MLRRWYAVLAGLLAVGGLSYYLYGAVPVDYKATGNVVLLPSAESVGKDGNPYLFLTGLNQAMDVLTRRLSAPDTVGLLTHGHPGSSFIAAADETSGSSILLVTAKGRTPADATSLVAAVVDDVPSELAAMQDDLKVPQSSRISSMKVAAPTAPIVDAKSRIQVVAGTGIAGLVAVVLLTALLDGLLLRWARRRADKRAAAELSAAGKTPKLVPVVAAELEDEDAEADELEAEVSEPTRRQGRVLGGRR